MPKKNEMREEIFELYFKHTNTSYLINKHLIIKHLGTVHTWES